jgi:hypothetical protein
VNLGGGSALYWRILRPACYSDENRRSTMKGRPKAHERDKASSEARAYTIIWWTARPPPGT